VIFGGGAVGHRLFGFSGTIMSTFYDAAALLKINTRLPTYTDRCELVLARASSEFPFMPVPRAPLHGISKATGSSARVIWTGFFIVQPDSHRAACAAANSDTQHEIFWPPSGLRTPDLYTDWLRDPPQLFLDSSQRDQKIHPCESMVSGWPKWARNSCEHTPAPRTPRIYWTAAGVLSLRHHGLRIQTPECDRCACRRSGGGWGGGRRHPPFPRTRTPITQRRSTSATSTTAELAAIAMRQAALPSDPYANNVLRIYSIVSQRHLFVDTGTTRS